MKRDRIIFYATLVAFFIGVGVRSFVTVDVYTLCFILFIAVVVTGYYLYQRHTHSAVVVLFICIAFAGGMFRFWYSEHRVHTAQEHFAETTEEIHGLVISEPVEKETTQQFIVVVPETHIMVIADRFPQVHYGDTVTLAGTPTRPESFTTDTGRTFNYPQYLAKDGVTHQLFFPAISIDGHGGGSFVKRKLFALKDLFLERVRMNVPEPHASLLGGLVVGSQEALGEDLLNAFRIVGIIHIVVLSGYNVTIVAEAIARVFRFLPRLFGVILGAVGIVLFAILTGGSATIIRASIMALLVLLARVTGRQYDIGVALIVAAFLMVLHNPYILAFDPSFQLSFLATIGLIYLAPHVETFLGFIPTTLQLREFATATIATQLFVLPLLLYQVGTLSTVAIVVNLLVLAVVPLTMLVGFLTGVVGMVSVPLALPLGFVVYVLLAYMLHVVSWFSALPFASISISSFPAYAMLFTYGVYAVVLFVLYRARSKEPLSEFLRTGAQ